MNDNGLPTSNGMDPDRPRMPEPTPAEHQPAEPPPVEPLAAVAPASDAPALAPVTSSRPGAARWGVALLVAAVVIGVAAVAVILAAGGGSVSRLAGWVPPGSYAYAELRLDPPGDQSRRVGDLLAHFPGFADQAQLDAKLTESADRLLGTMFRGNVSYSSMKPWLGDSIALAATGIPSSEAVSAPAVLIVATKDPVKARDWIVSSLALTGTTTETHGAAELTVGLVGRMPFAYTVLDTVVLAGEKSAVEAAVDTNGSSGFTTSEPFRTAVASIDGDNLGVAFLDMKQLVQGVLSSVPAGAAVDAALIDRVPPWMMMALHASSDALEVVAATPAVTGTRATTNRTSALAGRLPAETLVALETRDIGAYLRSMLDELGAAAQTADVARQLEQALEVAGGFDSTLGWMGDGVIAVTGAGGSFGGGIVVATLDAKAAADKLVQLRNLFVLAGGTAGVTVRDEAYGDGTITILDLGDLATLASQAGLGGEASALPSARLEVAYTVQKDLLVVGIGDAFVKAVIDTAAGTSLADQSRYRTALERAGASNTGQAYVDLAGLIEASIPLLPGDARTRYEEELKPYLDPLAAFGAAGLSGDPMRVRFVITVR